MCGGSGEGGGEVGFVSGDEFFLGGVFLGGGCLGVWVLRGWVYDIGVG